MSDVNGMTPEQIAACTATRAEMLERLAVSPPTLDTWIRRGIITPPAYVRRGIRWIRFNPELVVQQSTR